MFWVSYCFFVLPKIWSKNVIFSLCWYPCYLIILHGSIQWSCAYYIYSWSQKVEYIIKFICVQLSLIISLGPEYCANTFWNMIYFTYSFHSIINDGLFLVTRYVFLWENLYIVIVIDYNCWPSRVKSNML